MSKFPYNLLTPYVLAGIVADLEDAATNGWMKGREYQHLDDARNALVCNVGPDEASRMILSAREALP